MATIGALALAPIAAQASGDNGGATPVAPATVFGATASTVPGDVHVALFFDPAYVDTTTGGDGEAYNLQQTLLTQGFDVHTFTGTTTAEWTAALTDADVVAVPELEVNDGLADDMEPGALAALQAFVDAGGRLTNYIDSAFPFMESVLGLAPDSLAGSQHCPC
jgi:hypothetical protein